MRQKSNASGGLGVSEWEKLYQKDPQYKRALLKIIFRTVGKSCKRVAQNSGSARYGFILVDDLNWGTNLDNVALAMLFVMPNATICVHSTPPSPPFKKLSDKKPA